MCGIIGYVGDDDETLSVLLDGLSNLEYRGYDSAGVAVGGDGLRVEKRAGQLDALETALDGDGGAFAGPVGIAHTRWSTHGPPTDANAHPHTDASGRVAVVHNGIIENYRDLRDELEADGVTFASETDTEVVPHLVAQELRRGRDPEAAVRATTDRLEGSYALAVVVAGTDALFAVRHDSPLVLGVGDGECFVASDVPAFLERTRDVVYLDDDEFVRLDAEGWTVTDAEGSVVDKDVRTVEWEAEQTGKSGYDHYMLKEIHEQPLSLRQCLSGRIDELDGRITVEELDDLSDHETVQFVACGTSYHAALYGAQLLRAAGVAANAYYAHEYATSPAPVSTADLVVGVTQSGETADTLSALREASRRGAETLALTNVVGSTAAREADHVLYIRAGPEIGVAATKTFSSQLIGVNLLTSHLTDRGVKRRRDFVDDLRGIANDVQAVLDESEAAAVVEEFVDSDAFFFLGRGLDYPVALEGALKFKEITYEHAEGFAAGELKHGPLALVTANTPIFAVITGEGEAARKTIGNVKEVEARDAPVVVVTDGVAEAGRYADHVLEIPTTDERLAPLLANVQLQLVAYHMAAHLDREIDKPRNLAKSVTVE
ncbi:glutamine--fructose-6-phosphate transaminase (isomerizing) [Haloplanus aerogenes]|uniref:Glutamine--fructose-6-phosphate aminotransferase [isomerizing] n=1 Tax=Haloplanus aerogenes TaxID=660522 RepID=A0A3G8QV52_9EURY|nr:glutamine--fructose-6-phosphate transaminase (isomerizing) [Haloplanus aerogenes]AZH26300.1 glutamine--fructose-6-phosphate transaminase (isomerizing) [Haloplanus aerogenes]RMB18242.1 glucosamine--fructose-6-phosphate aminotransferase (isomerizing) [Haloplanus aerogenes]